MEEENNQLIVYKKQHLINNVKVVLIAVCICILMYLIFIINQSIIIINGYKVYKQYEIQVQAMEYQEQQKRAEIGTEEGRIRQEKIPELTEKRKRKYRKYI